MQWSSLLLAFMLLSPYASMFQLINPYIKVTGSLIACLSVRHCVPNDLPKPLVLYSVAHASCEGLELFHVMVPPPSQEKSPKNIFNFRLAAQLYTHLTSVPTRVPKLFLFKTTIESKGGGGGNYHYQHYLKGPWRPLGAQPLFRNKGFIELLSSVI